MTSFQPTPDRDELVRYGDIVSDEALSTTLGHQKTRHGLGLFVGLVGLVWTAGILFFELQHFDRLFVQIFALDLGKGILLVVAYGIIAAAAVYFGFQLLRAAERLIVPLHMVNGRDLLGIDPPGEAAHKALTDTARELAGIIKEALPSREGPSEPEVVVNAASPSPPNGNPPATAS